MKMRRNLVAVIAAVIMAASFSLIGCGGESTTTTDTADQTTRTTFAVGFDQDFPPYGYVGDDGEYTGFDLDLAAEVAKRNGWEIEYVPINWDAKDLELESGAIDCIWNGFTIEGREDLYEWTSPYMDNSQVIVVRSDSGITSLAGLTGKTVMTQADSAALHLLEGDQKALADTFKALTSIPEYNTAFLELEMGSVDAIAIDLPVAKFQIAGKEDQYIILSENLSEEHYGVGFLKGNTMLRDTVESTLEEMVADGTVESICEDYAAEGISYDSFILGK